MLTPRPSMIADRATGMGLTWLFLINQVGCDMFVREVDPRASSPPHSEENWEMPAGGLKYELPRIDMEMFNGWGGYDNVSVLPGGLFIKRLQFNIPELSRQLSPDEYDQLISLFSGFLGFGPEYGNGCADGNAYTITISNALYRKTVFAGCGISRPDPDSVSAQLFKLVTELDRLSDKTYENEAPWIGLTNSVSLDRQSYALTDTIRIRYAIHNPTNTTRAVYFYRVNRIGAEVYRGYRIFQSSRGGLLCQSGEDSPCFPDRLVFFPGDSLVFNKSIAVELFALNQPSTTSYSMKIWLLSAYYLFLGVDIPIEVTV
ncbi:MAG: hypothetical protein BMS9Abin05_2718 [Rhodothermia bacterium]|nr:MAG: hypothetical protein BMS9Abin05_2718 [Rhodothermia bacterium]